MLIDDGIALKTLTRLDVESLFVSISPLPSFTSLLVIKGQFGTSAQELAANLSKQIQNVLGYSYYFILYLISDKHTLALDKITCAYLDIDIHPRRVYL